MNDVNILHQIINLRTASSVFCMDIFDFWLFFFFWSFQILQLFVVILRIFFRSLWSTSRLLFWILCWKMNMKYVEYFYISKFCTYEKSIQKYFNWGWNLGRALSVPKTILGLNRLYICWNSFKLEKLLAEISWPNSCSNELIFSFSRFCLWLINNLRLYNVFKINVARNRKESIWL